MLERTKVYGRARGYEDASEEPIDICDLKLAIRDEEDDAEMIVRDLYRALHRVDMPRIMPFKLDAYSWRRRGYATVEE